MARIIFLIVLIHFLLGGLGNTNAQESIEIPFNNENILGSYTIVDLEITFTITAKTLGYVGFGFSNSTGMLEADIFVGGLDNNVPYSNDYNANAYTQPNVDSSNDWTMQSAIEDGESTTIVFSRLLQTSDVVEDVIVEDKEMTIIWSMGSSDTLAYHTSRGSISFNLLNPSEATSTPTAPTTTTVAEPVIGEIPLGTDLMKVTYEMDGDTVTFTATAKTLGYVGFGFSNNSGMTNSDMFIGGVDDFGGEVWFGDFHSTAPGVPIGDADGNWEAVTGSQTGDETTIIFFRKLASGDTEKDIIIEDKEMTIIWSIGPFDNLTYHGPSNRGSISFNLFTPDATTPPTIITTPATTTTSSTTTPTTTTTGTEPVIGEIPFGSDLMKVTYEIVGNTATFTAIAKTLGYVGFGFSKSRPGNGMLEADIFVGGVNSSGSYFNDYNANAFTQPNVDAINDWALQSAIDDEGSTTLVFSRLLVTGDLTEDVPIEDNEMTIIWSMGSTDDLLYHGTNRGSISFNLFTPDATTPPTTTTETTTSTTTSSSTTTPTTTTTGTGPVTGEIPLGTDLMKVTYVIDGDTVTFTATAKTLGYLGFGFSNNSGMTNSDIFIGLVDDVDQGIVHFGDYHSFTAGTPIVDNDQNWDIASGSQTGDETMIIFSRKLESGDLEEDIVIEDKEMIIIWSMGSTDNLTWHGPTNRGSISFNLFTPDATTPPTTTTETTTPTPTTTTTPHSTTTGTEPVIGEIPFGSDLLKVTYEINRGTATFTAIAKTVGYVGFGFSRSIPGQGMLEADIFVGGVSNSVPYFNDYNSNGFVQPNVDESNDWTLQNAIDDEGSTTLVFSRLLVTGDLAEDVPIEDKEMTIIWSLGSTDDLTYHGTNRGSISFNLFNPPETNTTTTPTSIPPTTTTTTEPPMTPGEIPFGTDLMKVMYEIDGDTVTFTAIAKTLGYVGFGFSKSRPGQGMLEADIFVGGLANNAPYSNDYNSNDFVQPIVDSSNDWALQSAIEDGDRTTVVFSRRLDTGDLTGDVPIEDKEMTIIWSIGLTDDLAYHSNRGSISFNLLNPPATTTPLPNNGEIPLNTDLLQISYSIVGESAVFVATAKTLGYIGFGFSNISGMNSSDIFMCGVADDTGRPYFRDYWTDSPGIPVEDQTQNWILTFASQTEDETIAVFSRELITGDAENDIDIEDKLMNIIWAIGTTDGMIHHGENRGQVSFNLIAGQAPPPTPAPTGPTDDPVITTPRPSTGEIPLGTDLLKVIFEVTGHDIIFSATSRGTGYIGLGFSNSSGMTDSDIFIGGWDNGKPYFDDYYSYTVGRPMEDEHKNYVLISAEETDGETRLNFSRKIITGDLDQDINILNEEMSIIWAVGPANDSITHHGTNKGMVRFNLLGGLNPMPPLPNELPLNTDKLTVTYSIEEDNITFIATAKTNGFIGFGFSNETGMDSADMFIAGRNGSFNYHGDYVSNPDAVFPDIPIRNDSKQDWILISAEESESDTRIVFSRLLNTGDQEDVPIENKEITVIWSIGFTDDITYHGDDRGQIKYNFLSSGASELAFSFALFLVAIKIVLFW